MNSEPNRITTGAPVVLFEVVVRYRKSAVRPKPNSEHDPGREVASRGALDADQLHRPGGDDRIATKPHSAAMPNRYALEPPAAPMSPSASPANDCPRITVKTPTPAATIATSPPTVIAS